MAVPPSVPTAFVPHEASARRRRFAFDYGGAFAFVSYGVLLCTLIGAAGVFAYDEYLTNQQAAKEKQIAAAQASLDQTSVSDLIALQNRLADGAALLNEHQIFSPVFDLVDQSTLANVSLTSLNVAVGDSDAVKLTFAGTAKSFNALAAEAAAIAKDPRFQDAVFSDIKIGQGGAVGFALTATVNPKLTAFSAPEAPATVSATTSAPTASSTPSP